MKNGALMDLPLIRLVPTVFDEQRSLTGAETCRDTGASNEISSKRF